MSTAKNIRGLNSWGAPCVFEQLQPFQGTTWTNLDQQGQGGCWQRLGRLGCRGLGWAASAVRVSRVNVAWGVKILKILK